MPWQNQGGRSLANMTIEAESAVGFPPKSVKRFGDVQGRLYEADLQTSDAPSCMSETVYV